MATELDCVTHALNCISQPDWQLIQTNDIGREIDPRVPDTAVDFLADHLPGLP